MKINNYLKLVITVLVSLSAGYLGSFFTTPAIPTWYANLVKPALNPPSWVFAPVWTILFILMGIAAYLVWQKGFKRQEVKYALVIFAGQLILNIVWSGIFFGWQNPGVAFLELIVLWLAILSTIKVFAKVSKTAAWLLVPYILWVSFAGYLNFSIWQLNNSPAVVKNNSIFDPQNCAYVIEDQPVVLTNGLSVQDVVDANAKITTKYFGNQVNADFNADGLVDVAFLATQTSGGSGTFYYTLVALNTSTGCQGLAADFIGDRIAPQTTEFKDEMIIVNYADRKATESFDVAPSIGLSKYYKIIDGQLRAVVPPMLDYRNDPTVLAIQKMLIAKYPKYAKTLAVNLRQQTDIYAVGAISFEPGEAGGQYLAVKEGDSWQLVYEGNGSVDCVAIKQNYQFPTEMLAGFCD
ncbi:MAG: TspO/MBR family protein [Patescibacteria group bacterium]|jgi:tryptophan-rich sensory protein